MQTLLSFRREKWLGKERPPAKLVWAGHEPQQFINLFPALLAYPEVAKINQEVKIYFYFLNIFIIMFRILEVCVLTIIYQIKHPPDNFGCCKVFKMRQF